MEMIFPILHMLLGWEEASWWNLDTPFHSGSLTNSKYIKCIAGSFAKSSIVSWAGHSMMNRETRSNQLDCYYEPFSNWYSFFLNFTSNHERPWTTTDIMRWVSREWTSGQEPNIERSMCSRPRDLDPYPCGCVHANESPSKQAAWKCQIWMVGSLKKGKGLGTTSISFYKSDFILCFARLKCSL